MYTVNFIHFIVDIYLIFVMDVIFTLSLIIHLTWKLTVSVKPQPVVPLAVLFSGNLPVLGGGVEADVPQVLLEEPFLALNSSP